MPVGKSMYHYVPGLRSINFTSRIVLLVSGCQTLHEQYARRKVIAEIVCVPAALAKLCCCHRLINPQTMMLGQEPRQTTSNLGHLNKPSIQALIHGLNRHYYSIAINYR